MGAPSSTAIPSNPTPPDPNSTTFAAQVHAWSSFVLSYCRYHRIFLLELSSALESDLFYNKTRNRRLKHKDAIEILDEMGKEGSVEWVDPAVKTTALVYWRKPAEWGELIYKWVDNVGQKGTVLTAYELMHGEQSQSEEFHEIHPMVLQKALAILVKRGVAQTIGTEIDEMGIKFF